MKLEFYADFQNPNPNTRGTDSHTVGGPSLRCANPRPSSFVAYYRVAQLAVHAVAAFALRKKCDIRIDSRKEKLNVLHLNDSCGILNGLFFAFDGCDPQADLVC